MYQLGFESFMPLLMQSYIIQSMLMSYHVLVCVNHLCCGCDGLDMSVGNVNRLNVCWNNLYRKIFGFHRWESVKHVQL